MKNKVTIVATEFKTIHSGEITKGFRIYDSFGNTEYCNLLETISECDMDFFKEIIKYLDSTELLDNMEIDEVVEINGNEYTWGSLLPIYDEAINEM